MDRQTLYLGGGSGPRLTRIRGTTGGGRRRTACSVPALVCELGGDHAQEHAQDDQPAGPVVQPATTRGVGTTHASVLALPGARTGGTLARERHDGSPARNASPPTPDRRSGRF